MSLTLTLLPTTAEGIRTRTLSCAMNKIPRTCIERTKCVDKSTEWLVNEERDSDALSVGGMNNAVVLKQLIED
jgi:hypothetical protein